MLYTILQNEGLKKDITTLICKEFDNSMLFCDKNTQLGIKENFHNIIKATYRNPHKTSYSMEKN